ncbi:MAG: flagellar hook-associated protein FlgK [Planctomycetaceae bacterium]|nr:flagellar hook-associated protein FlgK [Planctomycetaceae bacterium]
MRGFDIGLSALRTSQQTLSTLGNNIANAATPGYHRQRVNLVTRPPMRSDALAIGTGVEVSEITRMRSATIETALRRTTSMSGQSQTELDIASQIETLLAPSETSVHANLSNFFNKLEQAANAPEDQTVRREFLTAVSELTRGFESMDDALSSLSRDIEGDMRVTVDRANQIMSDIVDINRLINNSRTLTSPPNDLLDRREALVTELSQMVDVDIDQLNNGDEAVLVGSGTLLLSTQKQEIGLSRNATGQLQVVFGRPQTPLPLTTGSLLMMQQAVNQDIPAEQERIKTLLDEIVHQVDQQHATGIPGSGPFRLLVGSRAAEATDLPLARAGLDFPVSEGDLYITMTDADTNVRNTYRIHIDPLTESMEDIAAKLDTIPGMATLVDPNRSTLTMASSGSLLFDFAGRVDNQPDLSAYTGSSTPEFSGQYTGNRNDQWTVTFSGDGEVGVTDGLTAAVKDSGGVTRAVLNIGMGYALGDKLYIADGVSVQFGAGNVVSTDSAGIYLLDNPDETGILSALGLNSIFEGTLSGGHALRQELLNHPDELAMSRTGLPGDAANFGRLAALRDMRFDAVSGRTFTEELAAVTADSGLAVQAAQSQNNQLQLYKDRLEADRAAVSGVDINEEMLKILEVERAFQAASRYITAVDSSLQELMGIIR